MKARYVIMLAAAALISLGLSQVGLAEQGDPTSQTDLILTGGQEGLYLIRLKQAGDETAESFSLVLRPTRGKWQWVSPGRTGQPTGAVALAKGLQVFFADGGCYSFGPKADTGAPGPKLAGPPLAACYAPGFADATGRPLLAILPSAPATDTSASSASSQPASMPPSQGGLAIFQLANAKGETGLFWKRIGLLAAVSAEPDGPVLAAAVGRTLYVLQDAGSPSRTLTAWRNGRTYDVPLGDLPAKRTTIAMLTVDENLVLVLTGEPARGGSSAGLTLAIKGTPDEPFTYQPVVSSGADAPTWPVEGPPLVTAMGKDPAQLALLWVDDDRLKLAAVELTGKLTALSDVEIFGRKPTGARAEQLLRNFVLVVMIGIFVMLFVARPRSAPVPFTLPEGVRPGSMPKRAMALLIDYVPISIISAAIFLPQGLAPPPGDSAPSWDMLMRWMEDMRIHHAHEIEMANILCLSVYTIYSAVMESLTGATLGKKLMKLKVVANGATRPTRRQIMLRNLVRTPLLANTVLLPLLLVFPLLSPFRQRLGDMFARTTVVDARTLRPGKTRHVPPTLEQMPAPDSPDEPPADDHDRA